MSQTHPHDLIRKAFCSWYKTAWEPWIPEKSYWHYYRFQKFNNTWVQLKENVRTPQQFKKILLKRKWVPKNSFYSVLRWLNPQEVRRKSEQAYCLGGQLVFDLDILRDFSLPAIDESKDYILNFLKYLRETFRFERFRVVFSGQKGFHVYVLDFDSSRFTSIENVYRETMERIAREQIARKIHSSGYEIDVEVTSDTRRIIRLPLTLHGQTALKCIILDSDDSELDKSNLKSAIAFSMSKEVETRIVKNVNKFRFFDEEFGPYKENSLVIIPEQIALYLHCQGSIEIR